MHMIWYDGSGGRASLLWLVYVIIICIWAMIVYRRTYYSARRGSYSIFLEGFSSSCTVTQAYYIDIRWGGRSRGLALYYDVGDWRGQSSHKLVAHVHIHTAATVYMSPIGRGNLMLSTAKEKRKMYGGGRCHRRTRRHFWERSVRRARRYFWERSVRQARRYFWERSVRSTTDEEKKTEGRLSPVGQLPSTMAVVISLFLPGRGIVHHGHGFLQKKNNNNFNNK